MQQESVSILLTILGGGVAAVIGGYMGVAFPLKIDKVQRVNNIKSNIIDELDEIAATIDRLCETYTKGHTLSNDYFNDLNVNAKEFYDNIKPTLYLIHHTALRKEINGFYKKLNENLRESINKVGKLGLSIQETVYDDTKHSDIINTFKEVKAEAISLKIKLESYRFKIFFNKRQKL